jgi:hypothetical protein
MTIKNLSFDTYSIPAGGQVTLNKQGQFVNIVTCDQPVVNVQIDNEQEMAISQGVEIRPAFAEKTYFETVRLENPSASTMEITVGIGYGQIIDRRLQQSITGTLDANITNAELDVNITNTSLEVVPIGSVSLNAGQKTNAATTGADVVAANLNRQVIYITNPSSNASIVWISESGGGDGEGIELKQGATLQLNTTDAIGFYNPHGSSQTINFLEELKV